MNDFDLLSHQDVPQYWNITDHRRQNDLIVEHLDRNVVHLQSVGHVADPLPVAIGMRHDDYLVAAG